MGTEIKESTAPIVKYDLTDAAIAEMKAEFMPLRIRGVEDKAGLASVHEARMTVKGKRVEVEKTRKELKADALAWGKKVDAEANRIKAQLQPIEDHLCQEEDKVKAEKARIKAEAERREEERLQFRVNLLQQLGRQISIVNIRAMTDGEFQAAYDEAKAEHEAEQARLTEEKKEQEAREEADRKEKEAKEEEDRKARDAEDARLKEQKAEQDRVAKEQAKKDAALQRATEQIEADRLALEDEKRRKKEAEEAVAEADRIREATAKRETAYAERQEALKPDKEKLIGYEQALQAVEKPVLKDKKARAILADVVDSVEQIHEFILREIKDL